tara:strand:- start:389 stop:547 length:159 start_codon:yes stop_codon:yes gene_type:complete
MPRYGYYSKNSTSKEIIKSIDATHPNQATIHFAEIKNLDFKTFSTLYEVIER